MPCPSPFIVLHRLSGPLALLLLACLTGCESAPPPTPGGIPPLGDDDDDSSQGDDDDSASSSDDDDSASPGDDDDSAEEANYAPAFYPSDRIHSPISSYVADRLWDLGLENPELAGDVFLKAGASSTVSSNTLHCFAGESVDLGTSTDLEDTLDHFLAGDAAGTTPFDRETLAARIGHSAGWVIDGAPSPLVEEFEALNPLYSLVHYGTNDMGMGTTYASAMVPFHENMMALIRTLVDEGSVPILCGISPRGDSANADLWVSTYNAAIRGMAQAWQIPFIDIHKATAELDGYGLAGDGIHLNAYSGGACMLTEAGLEYGYNVRNLIVLEALDRVHRVVGLAEEELDDDVSTVQGSGSPQDPFVIHELPFAHVQNTAHSTHRKLELYSGCDSDTDESGPEYLYRLELDEETALRLIVLDEGDVDIDLHLLDESGSEEGCIERAHQVIETTVPAGTYTLSLDTWVNSTGDEQSGEYILLVVPCTDGDSACE